MKSFRLGLCVSLLFVLVQPLTGAEGDKRSIAKIGKAATALVEVKRARGLAYGSAFCIHSEGFFLTNHHVVMGAQDIKLVLNAGHEDEKTFTASVLRSNPEADLALLRVEATDLPCLALGSDGGLTELTEVVAFGFPFGQFLSDDRQVYPAISINAGKVTALRRKNKALHLIQIDAVLNPGNSGGPVLDQDGKVLGVVVAGVKGSGINFAIPVSKVQPFVEAPEITFHPPALSRDQYGRPMEFEVKAVSPVPTSSPFDIDLILSLGKYKRTSARMSGKDSLYKAKIQAVDDSIRNLLDCIITYDDGSVAGLVEDRTIKIGENEFKLSEIQAISLKKDQAVPLTGAELKGKIAGLDALTMNLGGKKMTFALSQTAEIKLSDPKTDIAYTIIVSRGGKEIHRLHTLFAGTGQWNKHFLCDMKEFDVKVGYGTIGKGGKLGYFDTDKRSDVSFQGKKPAHAISLHPGSFSFSSAKYRLDRKSAYFKSTVGLHESSDTLKSTVTFEVLGDGKTLWTSKSIKLQGETDQCLVDVSKVSVLEIRVNCAGDFHAARAIWVDPQLSNSVGN